MVECVSRRGNLRGVEGHLMDQPRARLLQFCRARVDGTLYSFILSRVCRLEETSKGVWHVNRCKGVKFRGSLTDLQKPGSRTL